MPGGGSRPYHDTMLYHDEIVGQVLDQLDELGHRRQHDRHVLDRQRAAHELVARRRHDAVPQREELELGGRLPGAVRRALARAGSRPGTVLNGIVSHNDWFVTLLAAAGQPRHRRPAQGRRRARRHRVQGPPRRVQPARLHHRAGRREPAPALLLRVRRRRPDRRCGSTTGRSCSSSSGRRARCGCGSSRTPSCGSPKIFNLRTDPFERADITSNTYYDWMISHAYLLIPAQQYVAQMLQTLAEFPAAPGAGLVQRRQGAGEAEGRDAQLLTRSWRERPSAPTRSRRSTTATPTRRPSPSSAARGAARRRASGARRPPPDLAGPPGRIDRIGARRRVRHVAGGAPRAAPPGGAGRRDRRQRGEPRAHPRARRPPRRRQPRRCTGCRSRTSASSASGSTTSCAPACCTTSPTRPLGLRAPARRARARRRGHADGVRPLRPRRRVPCSRTTAAGSASARRRPSSPTSSRRCASSRSGTRSAGCCASRGTSPTTTRSPTPSATPASARTTSPELLELIEGAGLRFGRWERQAPYLPDCGAISETPHAARIAALPARRAVRAGRAVPRHDHPAHRDRLRRRRRGRRARSTSPTGTRRPVGARRGADGGRRRGAAAARRRGGADQPRPTPTPTSSCSPTGASSTIFRSIDGRAHDRRARARRRRVRRAALAPRPRRVRHHRRRSAMSRR